MVTGRFAYRLVRRLVICGCIVSTAVFAASASGRDRGDGADGDAPASDRRASVRNSRGSQRGGLPGRGARTGDSSGGAQAPAGPGLGLLGGLFGSRDESRDRAPSAIPRMRTESSPQMPAPRGPFGLLFGSPLRGQSRTSPFLAQSDSDSSRRGRSQGSRGGNGAEGVDRGRTMRSPDNGPRVVDRPASPPPERPNPAPAVPDRPVRAPRSSDRPTPAPSSPVPAVPDRPDRTPRSPDRPTVAPSAPAPAAPERPSRAPIFDRPAPAPAPGAPGPQFPRSMQRGDSGSAGGGPVERYPARRGGAAGAGAGPQVPSQPTLRPREDGGRGVARPVLPDSVRRPDGGAAPNPGQTPSYPRTGTGVTRQYPNGTSPVFRPRDEAARSLGRPGEAGDRTRIGNGATRLDNPSRVGRSGAPSLGGSTPGAVGVNRSQPVPRTRGEAVESLVRPGTSGDRLRGPLGETRGTRGADVQREARAPLTRGPADAGVRSGGTNRVRTIDRSGPAAGRAGSDRMQAARTASSESLRTRTLARGSVGGREVFVRSQASVSRRDVRVLEVGHHESHGGRRVEVVTRHRGWDPHYSAWHEYHGDWWHHGHDHHHVDFNFSFTFVHSYFAPAGAVVYDVVPVAPVVVAPAPVFSASFAYYSSPAVVSVSSVRYVYPVAAVAPAVVVYHEYVAPPIITPVVFTPVATTPVYAAPVVMPVYAPVFAPVYYYYPSYAVLSYPSYYVEPAPVVAAAPAVVEAPSSGWSISTAFGFSHHGKDFSFGGTFTKARSEPAVVAAPAVAAPAPAVAGVEVPAEVLDPAVEAAAAPAGGPVAEGSSGGVEASGSATVPETPAAQAEGVSLEAGLAAIRGGDMEQARRILSQVIANDPGDGVSRMLYASALLSDGQYKDAAEALRSGLEAWQDLQLKDFYLPSVYEDTRRFTQAMRDAGEFLSDHPERVDAWLLVSFAQAFSGQAEQAQSLLVEAQKTWPDDPTFTRLLQLVQAG